jgi:hypothetical protein
MFYIKMKNFSHIIHLGLFATQDSMDYLIHHINERADNLRAEDRGEDGLYRFILHQYNENPMNQQNRSSIQFNSLLDMYNYLYENERQGDERNPTIWVNHERERMGSTGGSRRRSTRRRGYRRRGSRRRCGSRR